MPYRFERVESEAALEKLFRLAHEVFAGELRQYGSNADGRLVDKFHHKNTYIAAWDEGELAGMAALHDQPPFSAAEKLTAPSILGELGRLIEVRLLAVRPHYRRGAVMAGLMLAVYEYSRTYDAILISGITGQERLYHALGFRDLGPAVLSGESWFVPMVVRVADLKGRQLRWRMRFGRRAC